MLLPGFKLFTIIYYNFQFKIINTFISYQRLFGACL